MDGIVDPLAVGIGDGPSYRHQHAAMNRSVRREDPAMLGRLMLGHARELVVAAGGEIDVVTGLADPALIRSIDAYFGTPGPNAPTQAKWARDIYWQLFINTNNAAHTRDRALRDAAEWRSRIDGQIAERKRALQAGEDVADDVLSRLLRAQAEGEPSFNDRAIRDNILACIVNWIPTMSNSMAHAVDVLLEREDELEAAREAARIGDREIVGQYVWEALRFSPPSFALLRRAPEETTIAAGTERETIVPAGSTVFAATLSAMHDERALADPEVFRIGRPWSDYMLFGHGLHTCYGEQIAKNQLPAMVTALLECPEIRRSRGRAGKLSWEGPFPSSLSVRYIRPPAAAGRDAGRPFVFVSYMREDASAVERLVADLQGQGVEVWFDRDRLKPGVRWRSAIRDAIKQGAFFIACFSENVSARERSYMNEELTIAVDELRKRPIDRGWFLPILLSPDAVPALAIGGGTTLRDIAPVALYDDWEQGVERLVRVIRPEASARRDTVGASPAPAEAPAGVGASPAPAEAPAATPVATSSAPRAKRRDSIAKRMALHSAGRGARRGYLAPGDPSPPPTATTDYLDYRGVASWQEAQNLDGGQFPLGAFIDLSKGRFRGSLGLSGEVISRHAVVVGPAGSGKTFSLLIPWIYAALMANWSVIAVDAAGTLRDDVLNYEAAQGSAPLGARVTKWDFTDPMGSLPWSWFGELEDDARVDAAITALLGRRPEQSADPYFYQRDYRTLRGLLLFARFTAASTRTASELIRMLEDDTKLDALVTQNPRAPGVTDLEAALRYPRADYAQIIGGVVAALRPLDSSGVNAVTRGTSKRPSINLDAVLDDHQLLIVGAALKGGRTSAVLSSMLLNQLSQRLSERLGRKHRPVLLVIDEAPQIIERVDVARLMAVSRNAGMGVVMAMQDVAQIKAENDRSWIVSDPGVFAILPGASPKSVTDFGRRLGQRFETTIGGSLGDRRTSSGAPPPSQALGTEGIPVLREREIMQPPFGERPAIIHVTAAGVTTKPLLVDMQRDR